MSKIKKITKRMLIDSILDSISHDGSIHEICGDVILLSRQSIKKSIDKTIWNDVWDNIRRDLCRGIYEGIEESTLDNIKVKLIAQQVVTNLTTP